MHHTKSFVVNAESPYKPDGGKKNKQDNDFLLSPVFGQDENKPKIKAIIERNDDSDPEEDINIEQVRDDATDKMVSNYH